MRSVCYDVYVSSVLFILIVFTVLIYLWSVLSSMEGRECVRGNDSVSNYAAKKIRYSRFLSSAPR